MNNRELIGRLEKERVLSRDEWIQLFETADSQDIAFAAETAGRIARRIFGKKIYFRGIVEFTNICRNDCLYCGIRRSNSNVGRYRLTTEDILECCEEGYANGFRTFVLQGGEDAYFTDERMCAVISAIHERWPDCAVTLSLGERSRESYQALFDAGAARYLLRHETADPVHYAKLHPSGLTLENRMRCLRDLKEIGYQTGCGMMIGTPYQTSECLAEDMLFMTDFQPHMIGIGPFLPHRDTPFKNEAAGSVERTLLAIALCRIAMPDALIPSTTALGTAEGDGRKKGVLAGCNVVMPNLSPLSVRRKYMLYDNKAGIDMDAAAGIAALRQQMEEIGYEVVAGRGDFKKHTGDIC